MSKLLKRLLAVVGLWFFPGLTTAAAVVGIAAGGMSLMNGLSGGDGGGGGGGYMFRPGEYRLRGADGAFYNQAMQGNDIAGQLVGTVDPTLRAILASRLGQDYSGLTNAAPGIADMYSSMAALDPTYAAMLRQAGGAQFGAGNAGLNAGLGTLNTAMDPMGNARNDLWQQVLSGTRAGDASRGIVMSPQSAGVESRAGVDFNTAWDMNNLQRQVQGLQALQAAIGGAGSAFTNGSNMLQGSDQFMKAGIDNTTNAAMTPAMINEIINKAKMGALQDYTTGVSSMELAPLAGQQGQLLNYMGLGNSASNAAQNQGNIDRQFNAQQQAGGGYSLANGLNGLAKIYPGNAGPQVGPGSSPNVMPVITNNGSGGGGTYTSPQF